ncbi:unnamed protein product [Discula destructiva]
MLSTPSISHPTHFNGLPAPFTQQALSFSAKPLPTSWADSAAAAAAATTTTTTTSDLNGSDPNPPSSAHIGSAHIAPSGGPFGCQTTVMGAERSPCAFMMTKHTTTTTVLTSINCHGCTSVHVLSPMYMCPPIIVSGPGATIPTVTTATTPYTWVSTVCEALTALSQLTGATETAAATTAGHISGHTLGHTLSKTVTAKTPTQTGATRTTPLTWLTTRTMEELPWFTAPNWHTWGASPPGHGE